MRKNRRRVILILLCIVVVIVALTCVLHKKHPSHNNSLPSKQKQQEQPVSDESKKFVPEVETLTIKRELFSYFIRLPGTFISYESVNLYPKTDGFIYNIPVDRGSIVYKNDVLVQLYDPELDAKVGEAEARYLAARERYERAEPVTPQVVSPVELAALRGEYQATFKGWQALVAQRSFLTITAPFDGIITTRYLHTGALVNKGSAPGSVPILKIERLDRLRLIAFVPQASVSNIAMGTPIQFSINAYPDQSFSARIVRPAYDLNLATLTEPVELDVYNGDFTEPLFMPGMLANLEWPATRNEKTFVVPKNAIVTTTYDMFVIRIKNNLTEWISVNRGYYTDKKVEIFGDLQDGDQIVLNASDQLRENTPVNIVRRL